MCAPTLERICRTFESGLSSRVSLGKGCSFAKFEKSVSGGGAAPEEKESRPLLKEPFLDVGNRRGSRRGRALDRGWVRILHDFEMQKGCRAARLPPRRPRSHGARSRARTLSRLACADRTHGARDRLSRLTRQSERCGGRLEVDVAFGALQPHASPSVAFPPYAARHFPSPRA